MSPTLQEAIGQFLARYDNAETLRGHSATLQAFARLMMLADVARRHQLRETHHVFGLLFGDTMTLKTTVGQFLAFAFGEVISRGYAGRAGLMRDLFHQLVGNVRVQSGLSPVNGPDGFHQFIRGDIFE